MLDRSFGRRENLEVLTVISIPPELLGEKVGSYVNYGKAIGPAALLGVLQGRCRKNYGKFVPTDAREGDGDDTDRAADEGAHEAEPDDTRSNLGELTLTQDYLAHLPDGCLLQNLGRLIIGPDVSQEMLSRKIGRYENLGTTCGPAGLLGVLQSRCANNLGRFEQI